MIGYLYESEENTALMAAEEEPQESFAQAFIREVNADLEDIKHSFFRIGFRLYEANQNEYYKEFGYGSIIELAETEFGFEKTKTYELIRIYELAYDKDKPMYISEGYDKYSQKQLSAISKLKYTAKRAMAIIKPTDSTRNIEKFVKFWNKTYGEPLGMYRGCNTVSEYLAIYDEEENGGQVTYKQIPGQLIIEATGEEEIFRARGKIEEKPFKPAETAQKSEFTEESGEKDGEQEPTTTDRHTREEVIAECMRRDMHKDEIYNKYLTNPTREEFIAFLKKLEGTRGGPWHYGNYFYREYSPSKGITLTGHNCENLNISWGVAAATIKKLIEEKSYRTEDELNMHPDDPAPENPEWDKLSAPVDESETSRAPEKFSEIAEKETYYKYLQTACISDIATSLSEYICALPPSFGSEMPYKERIEKWLFNWLISPRENKLPEPAPTTNRAWLEQMTTENFVNAILMQILRIYPLKGESAAFSSTLRPKLKDWLDGAR